jgi:hypothetical protein
LNIAAARDVDEGEGLGEEGEEQVLGHALDLNIGEYEEHIGQGLGEEGVRFPLIILLHQIDYLYVFSIGTKKTFYPNDVKFAIYTELLARTDQPILQQI